MHTQQLTFTKRYNANIARYVYYVKSNTQSDYDKLLNAVCKHYNINEYACSSYNSTTHKYALKAIDTNTGEMLHTDYTF